MTEFEALYERYARDVHRFALYLCGERAAAEDITSETFVRAWNASGPIRAATAKAYLFTIARNIYLGNLRRAGLQAGRHAELDENLPDPGARPDATAAGRSELERVMAALRELPEIDRTVLLLRAQEEWSYEEIAQATGLSLAAVKVKIHRARTRLAAWRAGAADKKSEKKVETKGDEP
jgi:RNA polymerase sigma-70 factor, ECF subfamily